MQTVKMSLRRSTQQWFSRGILALTLAGAGLLAAPAHAQSDADLRKQNQELTTKVKDLETELAAARQQVDALQKRITSLEAQVLAARSAGGGSAPIAPLNEERVTIDESHANASPRALLAAVTDSYKKAVVDTPMGQSGDRERAIYMRKLDKWQPATEREYRMPIEWTVRIEPQGSSPGDRIFAFVAVDPITGTRLGDQFTMTLSSALANRLADLDGRGEATVLALKGTVVPAIRINPKRESRGAFDNPRFVGPFAEFAFAVEPTSIAAYKPPPATQPAAPPTPAAPAAPPTK